MPKDPTDRALLKENRGKSKFPTFSAAPLGRVQIPSPQIRMVGCSGVTAMRTYILSLFQSCASVIRGEWRNFSAQHERPNSTGFLPWLLLVRFAALWP